ncbi:hypothetical protein BC629DRAFT_399183 [Irpex lacteus]|nr:hypothetical protein BC629DRAFT_399183 [Irpex lacteus]
MHYPRFDRSLCTCTSSWPLSGSTQPRSRDKYSELRTSGSRAVFVGTPYSRERNSTPLQSVQYRAFSQSLITDCARSGNSLLESKTLNDY